MSDYADEEENVEDALYGNLVAMETSRDENGVLHYTTIPTEFCSIENL